MSEPQLTRRRKLVFAVVLVSVPLLGIELLARLVLVGVLAPTCDAPSRCVAAFLWPDPLELYYPELAALRRRPPQDDVVDVLVLGGSVLNPRWSAVGAGVGERISFETRRPSRVHNLAVQAHTSRDSWLKYRELRDLSFDVVLFYHGINEARANNAPPELFDPDYEHYSWYRYVNAAAEDPLPPLLVAPTVARQLGTALGEGLGLIELVPTHFAEPEWIRHGHEVRTRASFRANLEAILALAAQKSEPVVLMTFATWLPGDYTRERFDALQTGYTTHKSPLEMWGDPQAVLRAVEVHNAEVRAAAAAAPGASLVDQAARMPRGRRFFNDVCHLTVEGSLAFVANLMPEVVARVGAAGERAARD